MEQVIIAAQIYDDFNGNGYYELNTESGVQYDASPSTIMRALSGRLIECSTVPPKGVQRGSVLELLYLNEQHSFMSVLHHLFAFVLECRKPMHDAQSSS